MTIIHWLKSSLVALILVACLALPGRIMAQTANLPVISPAELSKFDGMAERKAYYAYEGLVYDVTGSRLWKEGQHFGLQAGQDLTGKMGDAPHGTEVFKGFTVVGRYESAASTPAATEAATSEMTTSEKPLAATKSERKLWYEGPIRILNISILGWTGILLALTFTLNFATCFALPWSKLPLPWKGARPGPDAQDGAPTRQHWAALHKYFAWSTVVIGLIHGIIGLLQMWGFYL